MIKASRKYQQNRFRVLHRPDLSLTPTFTLAYEGHRELPGVRGPQQELGWINGVTVLGQGQLVHLRDNNTEYKYQHGISLVV